MSSGKGAGRGALIKKLLEAASTSSSDEGTSGQRQVVDSGLGQSQTHSPSLSVPKGSGRGRLFEQISSSSSSDPPKSTGGRGRAQLLQSLRDSQSTSSPEEASVQSSIPSVRGRGRIFAEVLASQAKTTVEAPAEPVESFQELSISSSAQEEPQPIVKRGSKGEPCKVVCNYVRLHSDPDKGLFEYEVRFFPNVDSRNMRVKYLNEHRDKFGGTKTFDGVILFLPILLPDKVTTYTSRNHVDNSEIQIKIIYKKRKPMRECMHFYNVLFDKIMKTLNYVRFDRKQYDPTAPITIPAHKLEVWPGYVTAVDEYEGGIMLCCDVSHRLLCQTTVLETLNQIYYDSSSQFQENAKKTLLGSVVITRYNNLTYRIDDINFDQNPMHTFKSHGRDISYMDYYKTQYDITLKDRKQPLLINIKKRRVGDTTEELMFCLIPELCYLTGLRDEVRNDFTAMRQIATHTRVNPNHRIGSLKTFYRKVNGCKEAREILSNWGLRLADEPENLLARQMEQEMISFARRQFSAGVNADFGRYATNNELLEVVNITNWLLIHTRNDTRYANSFLDCLERNSRPMGIEVSRPKSCVLPTDKTEAYVNALRDGIQQNTQIVVLICPTSRDDRYAAIKKICCAEIPVPSQVINAKTLSNEAKNRSIVQKIALQMNCKLGGTLWSVKIPFQKVMICGIDSYHDAGQKGNSVAAFVASLNGTYTRWYSRAVIQTKKEEIVNGLCASLKFALQAYQKMNNFLPERIIIFRDGVGDGQLKLCTEYEVPQFEAACSYENPNYKPTVSFIVVQKRINTRIFMDRGNDNVENPNPGCVLDHTVTRKYLYDFFLISQSVRQGTVSPTHYVVIQDSANLAPDIIQRLSYKLCFLYYNWPGTVRVPACCQYAHKLAYLVGQSVKRPTSEKLADKLFYL